MQIIFFDPELGVRTYFFVRSFVRSSRLRNNNKMLSGKVRRKIMIILLVIIHQKAAVLPDCGAWWSGFSSCDIAVTSGGAPVATLSRLWSLRRLHEPAPLFFPQVKPEFPLCNNVLFSPKEDFCRVGANCENHPVREAARTHARTR
jgi:hypothetical protein